MLRTQRASYAVARSTRARRAALHRVILRSTDLFALPRSYSYRQSPGTAPSYHLPPGAHQYAFAKAAASGYQPAPGAGGVDAGGVAQNERLRNRVRWQVASRWERLSADRAGL